MDDFWQGSVQGVRHFYISDFYWVTSINVNSWPACLNLTHTKKRSLANQSFTRLLCAQNWIRTSTPLPALRPEHSASTNFAIWAACFRECKSKSLFHFSKFPQNIFKTTAQKNSRMQSGSWHFQLLTLCFSKRLVVVWWQAYISNAYTVILFG